MKADPISEKAVLAGLFQYGVDTYVDISPLIGSSDCFTVPTNELLYLCLKHAFEKEGVVKPDIASIYSAARQIGMDHILKNQAERNHIAQVIEFNVDNSNIRQFASKIRKVHAVKTIRRHLKRVDDELCLLTGEESISEILSIPESKVLTLADLLSNIGNGPQLLGQSVVEYIEDKLTNPIKQVGLSTGFPCFDTTIGGGLRPGSVSVVGARSKGFKSGFALNVAAHVAGLEVPVLYIDTELQDTEQIPRALALLTGQDIGTIETGEFGDNALSTSRIRDAGEKLKEKLPIWHYNIADMQFDEQISTMKRWIHRVPKITLSNQANPCLIIYDYLKLMNDVGLDRDMKEYQLLGFNLTRIHNLCVKYNIPILTFVQLNRDGISREDSSAISQSDRILWYCSNFSIFKPKGVEELAEEEERGIHNAGNFKLMPIACRHGAGIEQGDYINFHIKKNCFRITEGKMLSELLRSPNSEDEIDDSEEIEF